MKRKNSINYYYDRSTVNAFHFAKGNCAWSTGTYAEYYPRDVFILIDMRVQESKLLKVIFK